MKNEAYNKHYQTLTLRDSERNAPSERLRMAACVCEYGLDLCMCACVKPGIERFKLATAREIACIFRLCIQLDRICMCSYETVSRLYMCVCVRPFHCHSHSTITLYRNASKENSVLGFNPMWICAAAAARTHCLKFVQTSFHCSSTPFTLSLRLSFSSFPIASSLFPAYSSWPNHGRLLVDWWTHAATVLNTSFRMHRRYLCAQLHSAFFTHVCECHILFP